MINRKGDALLQTVREPFVPENGAERTVIVSVATSGEQGACPCTVYT